MVGTADRWLLPSSSWFGLRNMSGIIHGHRHMIRKISRGAFWNAFSLSSYVDHLALTFFLFLSQKTEKGKSEIPFDPIVVQELPLRVF